MAHPPESNPLLIPSINPEETRGPCCPQCKGKNFDGRNVQGTVLFTCGDCKNQWQGGVPGTPYQPAEVRPPEPPQSGVSFERPLQLSKDGKELPFQEVRRPIDAGQQFRKGVPEDDNNA